MYLFYSHKRKTSPKASRLQYGFTRNHSEFANLSFSEAFVSLNTRVWRGERKKIHVIGSTRVFKTQRKKISNRYCVLWPKLATKIFRAEPVFSMLLLMRQKMSRKLKLCMSFVSCEDKSTSKCQIDTRHACLKLLSFKECIVRVQIDFRQFAFWDNDRCMCGQRNSVIGRIYIYRSSLVCVWSLVACNVQSKSTCICSTINVEIKIPHFGSRLFRRKTEPETNKYCLRCGFSSW